MSDRIAQPGARSESPSPGTAATGTPAANASRGTAPPEFAVVIPAYNHAEYLGDALASALSQTERSFEVVVVDDGSTDNTEAVVRRFTDPRVKYLRQRNRGASAARNAGMRASQGRFIAFLDADDRWASDKLRRHGEFLRDHPDVGASYNSRWDVDSHSRNVLGLWRPPETVTLKDLVLGFPFSPSDLVVRREWAFGVNLFNERYAFYGDDLDFFCRLGLGGCRFHRVDGALNFRAYHPGRRIEALQRCVEDALLPLEAVFADPRCPVSTLAVRDEAYANHSLSWACRALFQGEGELGRALLRRAVALKPSLLAGERCDLLRELLFASVRDDAADHELQMQRALSALPDEMAHLSDHYRWAAAYGCLLKGTRAVLWKRHETGRALFRRAATHRGLVDGPYLGMVLYQLREFEAECGDGSAEAAAGALAKRLKENGYPRDARRLHASYFINRATRDLAAARRGRAAANVIRAIRMDPRMSLSRDPYARLFRCVADSTHDGASRSARPPGNAAGEPTPAA